MIKADAKFLGWVRTPWNTCFALYNVTIANHPSFGSTMTAKGLSHLNLRIPETPHPPAKLERLRMPADDPS